MIKVTRRPISYDERAGLIENVKPEGSQIHLISYYAVMVFFFSLLAARAVDWLVSMTSLVSAVTSLFASLLISVSICTYVAFKAYKARLRRYLRAEQDLESGIIEILEMNVERAWRIHSCTAADGVFLLQGRDDRFLIIDPGEDCGYFPRRWMKIERFPRSATIVDIMLDGFNAPVCMVDLEDADFSLSISPGICNILRAEDLPNELRLQVAGHSL